MFKKGLAVTVILLFIGVAFTSSINANVSKSSVEPIADVDVKEDVATPIQLVFQLIAKLRNHKDIQNVETEEDVLQIIESDEEIKSIYEQLSGNDCGCEEDISTLERIWTFPFICYVIGVPFFMLGLLLAMTIGDPTIWTLAGIFGYMFNCFWY